MSRAIAYKRTVEPLPEFLSGMPVPGDIDGIRKVANWVHQRRDEGWEVPFATADGFLLRYPAEGDGPRFHQWIPAGTHLLWTGTEFADMWGYEPALPVGGENDGE